MRSVQGTSSGPGAPQYYFRGIDLETADNKSLIKKILYVVVTLLPMAIYMVIYMPTFFWVESLEPDRALEWMMQADFTSSTRQ